MEQYPGPGGEVDVILGNPATKETRSRLNTDFIWGESFLSGVSWRDDKAHSVSGAPMIGLKGRGENTNKIPEPSENPGYPGDQALLRSK